MEWWRRPHWRRLFVLQASRPAGRRQRSEDDYGRGRFDFESDERASNKYLSHHRASAVGWRRRRTALETRIYLLRSLARSLGIYLLNAPASEENERGSTFESERCDGANVRTLRRIGIALSHCCSDTVFARRRSRPMTYLCVTTRPQSHRADVAAHAYCTSARLRLNELTLASSASSEANEQPSASALKGHSSTLERA